MHIEFEKKILLEYLELVSRVATKHQSLPILQCVHVVAKKDTIEFTATNLELSVVVSVPGVVKSEGEVAVPASLLLQTVQLMTHSTVVLKRTEDVLTVTTKTSNTNIKIFPHEDFPTITTLTESGQTINGALFALGIKTVAFAASQSTIKPELGSVYIAQKKEHSLTFVTTDSFRLVEKTVPQKSVTLENPILIPQKNAQEIGRILEVIGEDPEFIVTENQAAFRFGRGVYVATRLTEGSFPDYQQIIPKEFETHATVLSGDLVHALKKTNIFANTFMQVGFSVDAEKSEVVLTSDNSDAGKTTERISATVEGSALALNFNQRYVSEPIGYFSGESVTLHFAGIGRPLVIDGVSDTTLRYLVMPMNK